MNIPGMQPLLHHAHQHEQGAGADTMADDLDDGALKGQVFQANTASSTKPIWLTLV